MRNKSILSTNIGKYRSREILLTRKKMDKKCTSFTIGFIIGAAVAIALGFMFAPRAGKQTREWLSDRLRWLIMSPREKYRYLWSKSGSLRDNW